MVKQTTTNGQEINGYLNQPIGPTFNELYEAYLKLSKEELAMLLASKELAQQPLNAPSYPSYPTYPVYPYPTVPYPWITWYHTVTC